MSAAVNARVVIPAELCLHSELPVRALLLLLLLAGAVLILQLVILPVNVLLLLLLMMMMHVTRARRLL
jgi:hypothetical protein